MKKLRGLIAQKRKRHGNLGSAFMGEHDVMLKHHFYPDVVVIQQHVLSASDAVCAGSGCLPAHGC